MGSEDSKQPMEKQGDELRFDSVLSKLIVSDLLVEANNAHDAKYL